MVILAPSLLAADFNHLEKELRAIEKGGAKYLHFDVMDGIFVPNISFGIPVLKSLKAKRKLLFDVHLMIEEPHRYIAEFKEAGADILTIHYEAYEDIKPILIQIRKMGIKAGVAISPDTDIEVIKEVMVFVDMILVMSVYPGRGGQAFIEETYERIKKARRIIKESGLPVDLEVDGGIYAKNLERVLQAGANVIVSGTGIFKGDIEENTKSFMEILNKYENS